MDDAEPAPIPGDSPRVRPRHRPVWVRLDGGWRAGQVMDWYRVGGRWAAWVMHERADGRPWPEVHGVFYDPATVVRREEGDARPR